MDTFIKIRIIDREYNLKVHKNNEELLKKAGELIGEKAKSKKEKLGVVDKQDLLAMLLFDSVVEQIMREREEEKVKELLNEMHTSLDNPAESITDSE